MAKNQINEEQLTEARMRNRQDKRVPFLIRDDGMLYPNVPLVAKKNNFRPYHGDPKASLADRLRYLQGFGQRRKVTYTPAADEPFELGKASAEEIVAFAMEEFGAALDADKPIDQLRKECYELSQLPAIDLLKLQAGPEAENARVEEQNAQQRTQRRRRTSHEG